MMTEFFKHKHSKNHINFVLTSALKPLEWKEKVGLTQAILNRLKPNLPQEVLSQPEKFTRELEYLLKTYVQSQDKLKSMLRSY